MECTLSDTDLNGILFSEYPDDLSLDECRERLELEVEEAYAETETPIVVEEAAERPDGSLYWTGKTFVANQPKISAYYIFLIHSLRAHRELEALSPEDYNSHIRQLWRTRCAKYDAKKQPPP